VVKAESSKDTPHRNDPYQLKEIETHSKSRVFQVAENIDKKRIDTKSENGLLCTDLPLRGRNQQVESKEIEIR